MKYTKIRNINEYVSQSINPMKNPDVIFEMYSVPVYETGHPEYLRGDEIGSSKIVVQKDDILLCKINPRINRVWIVNDESDKQNIASSEWIVIRNSTYNPEFLAWYFRTKRFKKLMNSEVTGIGGSLTRAQPKRVAEYPVPIMERNRQDEIVCVLNKVKFIIDARKQELAELENLIKSRFVELFKSFIERAVPVDFENICEFVTVGIANSATHAFCDDGVIMFRNQNIKEDYLDTSDIVYITPDFADKYKTKRLKKNDLLIVRTGYPGVACLVPEQFEGSQTFTTLIARIKNDASINPRFVCHYINSEYGKRYVKDNSAGAAQQNFGATALSKLPICIPPIESQDEYIRFVEQVDKLKFDDLNVDIYII